jgi:hypothetical protein
MDRSMSPTIANRASPLAAMLVTLMSVWLLAGCSPGHRAAGTGTAGQTQERDSGNGGSY